MVREILSGAKTQTRRLFRPQPNCAVCTNQRDQQWRIQSNPANPVIRIRLQKSGQWKDAHGRRFALSEQPVKFYDYNF